MIKINVFNQADYVLLLLQREVGNFFSAREHLSFSGRHSELGKMINCAVCGLRHRSARVCVPVGALSDHVKLKGRFLKHRNAWGLQVLEQAMLNFRKDIVSFPNATAEDEDKLGKSSLSLALNKKRAERAKRKKKLLRVTKKSRKINRGR